MNSRHTIRSLAVGLATVLVSACSGCGDDTTGTWEAPPEGGGPSQISPQDSPDGGNLPQPSR